MTRIPDFSEIAFAPSAAASAAASAAEPWMTPRASR